MKYDKKVFDKLKEHISKKGEAVSIVIGNQKGGVGKTANSTLISYILAENGIKTLVIDLDPQGDASKTMTLTGVRAARERKAPESEYPVMRKTILLGIKEGDLTTLPMKIKDNLYLLPSYVDFEGFPKLLYRETNNDREETHFLKKLLDPLKADYEVIIIDTPPQVKAVTDNAIVFADYVTISLQTQKDSLEGAENYIDTLADLKGEYDLPIQLLGIIAVLNDKYSSVDEAMLERVRDEISENILLDTIVPNMARVKRFPLQGIGESDRYDKSVLDVYREVATDFCSRILEFEEDED